MRLGPMLSSRALNTGLGLVSILLWSTTVALSRSLAEQLGSLTAPSFIFALGGILGVGYPAITRRSGTAVRSISVYYLFGCGGLFVLYQSCLYLALGLARDHSQVLEVGLMNYLWPTLTLVFSVWVLRMRATLALVPGVAMAMTGVLLATAQNQPLSWQSFQRNLAHNSAPYVLGATAGAVWGLYSVLSRRWAREGQASVVPFFMLATAAILGFARLFVAEWSHWTARSALELLCMGLGSNLAYVCWDRAMRQGDLVMVAALSYLTPLLSTMVSSLYLGIVVGIKLWIGCALVVAGAVLCKLALAAPPETEEGARRFADAGK